MCVVVMVVVAGGSGSLRDFCLRFRSASAEYLRRSSVCSRTSCNSGNQNLGFKESVKGLRAAMGSQVEIASC